MTKNLLIRIPKIFVQFQYRLIPGTPKTLKSRLIPTESWWNFRVVFKIFNFNNINGKGYGANL